MGRIINLLLPGVCRGQGAFFKDPVGLLPVLADSLEGEQGGDDKQRRPSGRAFFSHHLTSIAA